MNYYHVHNKAMSKNRAKFSEPVGRVKLKPTKEEKRLRADTILKTIEKVKSSGHPQGTP